MLKLALTATTLGCGGLLYVSSSGSTVQAKSRWAPNPVIYQRDLDRSDIKVWISKKGLLSAAGHNLVLKVHNWQSNLGVGPDGECELSVEVEAKSLQVFKRWNPAKEKETPAAVIAGTPVTFGSMDSWSIGQIQGSMWGKDVLDVAKYPTVVYQGKGTKKGTALDFDGTLHLHGNSHPLPLTTTISVEQDPNGFPCFVLRGEVTFPQSKWGIKPFSQFFGSLQLKDEVSVKWEVYYSAKEQ